MAYPNLLYRYRWLDPNTIDRELQALTQAYLYAPPFSAMNDPMEAFYELGGLVDDVIDRALSKSGRSVKELHDQIAAMLEGLGLVSFSQSCEDLPMWAYYANGFRGICLEFEVDCLGIGDFQGERLERVTYASKALPKISVAELINDRIAAALVARVTRKRQEWAHEKEWRYVVGRPGPKHYLDNCLRRVLLGPRIERAHAERICAILENRPVSILQGEINGYDLAFKIVQADRPLAASERVGSGTFRRDDHEFCRSEMEGFLAVPYEALLDECERICQAPNVERIESFGRSGSNKNSLYLHTVYKLRNGREVYHKRYLDKRLRVMKPT